MPQRSTQLDQIAKPQQERLAYIEFRLLFLGCLNHADLGAKGIRCLQRSSTLQVIGKRQHYLRHGRSHLPDRQAAQAPFQLPAPTSVN